jgi:hypothetical protein
MLTVARVTVASRTFVDRVPSEPAKHGDKPRTCLREHAQCEAKQGVWIVSGCCLHVVWGLAITSGNRNFGIGNLENWEFELVGPGWLLN